MEKINIDTFKLSTGCHKSIEQGACLLELASHVAGEKFSDSPQCVCPALAAFGRRMNDLMDDENRQKLKAYLPLMLNTRDDKTLQRSKILAHAALTVFAPIALDAAKLPEWAAKMRALPFGEWEANKAVARQARAAAYAAATDAATDATDATYAAYAAAYAAATDAATDATYAAAADAAAADAAYAAADAARSAVRSKVWDATLEVFEQALSV